MVPVYTTTVRGFPLDEKGCLAIDVACISCEYNLKGLGRYGVCPECGTAVDRSLKGDGLRYSAPHWVRRISKGVTLILRSTQAMIAGFFLMIMLSIFTNIKNTGPGTLLDSAPLRISFIVLAIIGSLNVVLGMWLFTTREPPHSNVPKSDRINARRLSRLLMVIFGTALSLKLLTSMNLTINQILIFLIIASGYGLMISTAMHTQQIAARVPDQEIVRSANNACRMTLVALAFTLVGLALPFYVNRRIPELLGCGYLLTILICIYFLQTLSWLRKGLADLLSNTAVNGAVGSTDPPGRHVAD